MKKYIKKDKKNKAGFTLIEMLIVLIVVALLMAIIIPNVAGQRERIDEQSKYNMAEIINTQAETYLLLNSDTTSVSLNDLETAKLITGRQKEKALELLNLGETTAIELPITVDTSSTP